MNLKVSGVSNDEMIRSKVLRCTHRHVILQECLKPDSHRKIVQDYRSKTGTDQDILSESG